jgi:TolB protein
MRHAPCWERLFAFVLVLALDSLGFAGELEGYRFLTTSVRTGDTEIFFVDPYLGDAVNLTRSPKSEDRYPCFSPDGTRVAFISDRDGSANLYVMSADGRGVRQLTHVTSPSVCYMPSWAGDRIYFGLAGEKAMMASIGPDGTGLRTIAEGRDPSISPDAKTIVFTQADGSGWCVFACDSEGRNMRQLTHGANKMGAVMPCWSPDGRRIAYVDQVGDALEVFACDADGGNATQLTRLGKISTPPAWSPDGRYISFRVTDEAYWRDPKRMARTYAEKKGDKRPVWVMGADGSNPHVVEVLRYQCAMDGSRAVWEP